LPKVLRIGIIQSGKIIEERIVRRRETVTFGPNEKNTFVLPASDIPVARYELFETKGGPYTLSFTDAMQGRVSIDGDVHDLADMRTSGKARKRGKVYQLQLNEGARGKIVIGESTVLFQFVAPPPIQPRPQLPAAVRGGVLRTVDWFVTTLWIISFLLHAGVIIWWETTDWPVVSAWDKYMALEELITQDQATWDDKKKTAEQGEGDAEEEEFEEGEEEQEEVVKGPSKKQQDTGPKKSAEEIARERAEKRAALAAAIAEQGINKILGTLGGEGGGAIADVLRGGDVGADQDDLLSQVSGVGVATGETAGSLKGPAGGKGSGEAADISQIKVAGGDATVKTAGPGPEKKIKGKIKKKKPVASGGTGMMSSSDVAKVVNRRLGALKGCYEQALKRNPQLSGKVTIRFTISGSGKVTTARTTLNELTPQVGNCMVAAFKRFRFPPPEGGTVTFEYPFMFTPAG
jgi:TonB family protein